MEKRSLSTNLVMGCLFALTSCLALSVPGARAGTCYFVDDFEHGLGKWQVGGDTWTVIDSDSNSPSHSASYGPYTANANAAIKMRTPIDLSHSSKPVLVFWHRIGIRGNDYGYVEISLDGGTSWKLVDPDYNHPSRFTYTHRSTWSQETYDLSPYKSSSVQIQFRLQANSSSESWGWTIDDVKICEQDTATILFPFFDDFESGLGNWIVPCDSWQLSDCTCPCRTYAGHPADPCNYPWHSMADSSYPAYAYSCLTLAHPIDLSSSQSPVLTFWHQIGIQGNDYGYVEVSQDRGFTWNLVDPNYDHPSRFTYTWGSTWSQVQYDLSAYKSSPILIRFRLDADGSSQSWGWTIDDVEIREANYPADDLHVEIASINKSNCPMVQATVIVTDKNGAALSGLGASNFSVYEDGNQVMPIDMKPSTLPACVSLVLDFSGSMVQALAIPHLQWAAEQFVKLMAPEDRGEVIKFANGVEITQTYTQDKSALKEAIWAPTNLETNQTMFYDAVYQAISDIVGQQGCDSNAVVAMTDGKDTKSKHSATGIIAEARRRGIPVFTIGLGNEVDEDVLKAIAGQTGGLYYYAPAPADLEAIYLAIAGTLKNQYVVEYKTAICGSDSTTDMEHELTIMVNTNAAFGQDVERFHCPAVCKP